MVNNHIVVDFFPYFHSTGVELLELRIRMLDQYVDKFVICESNKTQSGICIDYNLKKTIEQLKLPKEKIDVIELDIPADCYLPTKHIDKINCYENNNKNMYSVLARTRERLQKDSLIKHLHNFKDDTVFIVSDSDEIVKPEHIPFIVKTVIENNIVLKIPLVHLEGKADFRVLKRDDNTPKLWDRGMFICTKQHLQKATPTMIRSNVNNPFEIKYIVQDGKRLEDLGWHFSWMGSSERRKIKRESFTHYNDNFSFLNNSSYECPEIIKIVEAKSLKEGDVPPSGDVSEYLKKYDTSLLPKEIFEIPAIKQFLLN